MRISRNYSNSRSRTTNSQNYRSNRKKSRSRRKSSTRRDRVEISSAKRRYSSKTSKSYSRSRTSLKSSARIRRTTRANSKYNQRNSLSRKDNLSRNATKYRRNTSTRYKTSTKQNNLKKSSIDTTYNKYGKKQTSQQNPIRNRLSHLEQTHHSTKLDTSKMTACLESDIKFHSKPKEDREILKAKKDWWEARLKNDEKGMKKAHERAEEWRKRGGKIQADEVTDIDREYLKRLEKLKQSDNVSSKNNNSIGYSAKGNLYNVWHYNVEHNGNVEANISNDANLVLNNDGSFTYKGNGYSFTGEQNKIKELRIGNTKVTYNSISVIKEFAENNDTLKVEVDTESGINHSSVSINISDKNDILNFEHKMTYHHQRQFKKELAKAAVGIAATAIGLENAINGIGSNPVLEPSF